MKVTNLLAVAPPLVILPFVSACHMTREEHAVQIPATETPQDTALSKSVVDRLVQDRKVDLTNVKVVSSGGTVYLTGTVASLDARQQAIKIAWDTPGVKTVVNSLVVEK